MNILESRIAVLEVHLAKMTRLLHETRSRLESQKEDIGALAEALSNHEKHPGAHTEVCEERSLAAK